MRQGRILVVVLLIAVFAVTLIIAVPTWLIARDNRIKAAAMETITPGETVIWKGHGTGGTWARMVVTRTHSVSFGRKNVDVLVRAGSTLGKLGPFSFQPIAPAKKARKFGFIIVRPGRTIPATGEIEIPRGVVEYGGVKLLVDEQFWFK